MTESEKRALVWQKIEGSEGLLEIYHYYPTLHDSRVIKVNCNLEKKDVNVTFYYSDMVGEDVDNIASTLITLCWENLVEADFSFDENDIYSLELEFIDDKYKAVLHGSCFEAQIISKNIKVTEVVTEPEVSEKIYSAVRFSLK